jgi:hypothetical protein
MMPAAHKKFLKALYGTSKYVRFGPSFWSERKKSIPEFLEISATAIKVLDSHKDNRLEDGSCPALVDIELRDGRPIRWTYRGCIYPFLDLQDSDLVDRAVRALLKAESR